MNKKYITWKEFDEAIEIMTKHYNEYCTSRPCKSIYGLPRGGLPIAVALSHKLNLPLTVNMEDCWDHDKILVVDDIADSGTTLKGFDDGMNVIFTMHHRELSKVIPQFWMWDAEDDWIVYPWETKKSKTKQDYLK